MTTPTPRDAIAGALFDFLGFLTTRDKPVAFGATEWAAPAADLLKEWAAMRGLSLNAPAIEGWSAALAQQPAASGEPAALCAMNSKPCGPTYCEPCPNVAAQPAPAPDAALRTAVRLVLDATPDQLPMALDALRDHASATQPAPAVPPGMVLVSSEPWSSQRIAGAVAWAAAWADPDLSPTDKAAAVYRAMLAAAPTTQQEPKP